MEPTRRVGANSEADSDAELATSLQRGEAQALESLYDRYVRLAFGLAYRMIPESTVAEDVVQEAFTSAWRNAKTYDPARGSLRGWLLSIVHHRAIDVLRASSRRLPEAPLDASEPQQHAPDAFGAVSDDLQRREVRETLAGLPQAQREALELAYFHGYTQVEIALRTGVPLGTVKGRMRIGLEKLRSLLEAKGIEP